jgi:hypothetical protein
MKKALIYVRIALHFGKMSVLEALSAARGIKDKILVDPDIIISPAVQLELSNEITALQATVTLRETDKSTSLTRLEEQQSSDLLITIEDIAQTTEKQANAQTPGVVATIEEKILRIGFKLAKAASLAGRFFKVFKTAVGSASIRIKALAKGTQYHWRWSEDGVIWTRVESTVVSNVTITGLPSSKVIEFQYAITEPMGRTPVVPATPVEPDWSDSITALIP